MPDLYLDMGAARLLSGAGIPEYLNTAGTNFPIGAYGFDTTTVEAVFFQFHITGYTSGNFTLVGDWYAAATSGAVVFQAALAAMTSGTDSVAVTSKSLATANSSSAITARGTTLYPNSLSITISNLDSVANGDWVTLKFNRNPADAGDNMAGDAIVTCLTLSWS